jgi:hypothetical protein
LEQRGRETTSISDGRWEIFKYQRQDFNPVIDPVKSKWVGVKTTKPAEQITQNIIRDIQTDA